MPVYALCKRAQLPRPYVPVYHHHAPPAIRGPLVVLKPIVLDQRCDVLTSELWKLRELAKKPSEIVEHALHDGTPVSSGKFGNGQPKVSVSDAPQPSVQMVSGSRNQPSNEDRAIAGQKPKKL